MKIRNHLILEFLAFGTISILYFGLFHRWLQWFMTDPPFLWSDDKHSTFCTMAMSIASAVVDWPVDKGVYVSVCVCVCLFVWTGEPLSALCANKTAALWDTGHPRSNSIALLKYYTPPSQEPVPSWWVYMSKVCVGGYIHVCVFTCTCRCVIASLWIVQCVFTHGAVSGLTVPSQYKAGLSSLSAGVLIDPCPGERRLEYVKACHIIVRA